MSEGVAKGAKVPAGFGALRQCRLLPGLTVMASVLVTSNTMTNSCRTISICRQEFNGGYLEGAVRLAEESYFHFTKHRRGMKGDLNMVCRNSRQI